MTITYHRDVIQGDDAWFALRCGRLTASEMKLIITPGTNKPASNDKERTHLYELASQRINDYVEPTYIGEHMLRGKEDEILAIALYSDKYEAVDTDVGFITNDKHGFTIGYSPDGLVGDTGQVECKSRLQKYQFETILSQAVPSEYLVQIQTGLIVSERDWCDFISYCGGMPMFTLRVFPDPVIQKAILDAASVFEEKLALKIQTYMNLLADKNMRLIPTERRKPEGEISV